MSDARCNTPKTVAEASACLKRAEVPEPIVAVARRLQNAGHAAVLVGGAVRDALLGLPASDWDLATSATPEEVQALFRRTIPTGIEHGTVTVLVRKHGREHPAEPVEVTTFRGEGVYVDGRRPSSVVFHRELREDLARRDFTVNAFAWDPIGQVFSDPFHGLEDLHLGIIRAVGDPEARFCEDGLRTMRAVRLCATRRFRLDPATERAIGPALPVLARVSRERIRIELEKLLEAPVPSIGLYPMLCTGMWGYVLPPLAEHDVASTLEAVDELGPDFICRLARLCWPLARTGEDGRAEVLARVDEHLRLSRAERARLVALTSEAVERLGAAQTPVEIRLAAANLGRAHVHDAAAVAQLTRSQRQAIESALAEAALTTGELAIRGRDLIEAGLVAPGRRVGRLLEGLLARVIEDPTLNERDALLALAPQVLSVVLADEQA